MNKTRFALAAFAALASVAAMAQVNQPSKPSGPNGEPFWFGPGPKAHAYIANSSIMDPNSRAWYEWDSYTGGWSGANNLIGSANTTAFLDYVRADTTINVKPYVYVDGYFGLSADVSGWGTNFNIDLGFSRFYVLHNAPVYLYFQSFQDAILQSIPTGPFGYGKIAMDYRCEIRPWLSPGVAGPIVRNFTFGPTSTPLGQAYLDPRYDSDFFAQVDIYRKASVYWNNPAGTYKAVGIVIVQNF
jgi:hypothetical protein